MVSRRRTTRRDAMMAALRQCREAACATMGEVEIHSELYRRLGRFTEAFDDVAELEDMASDREHFWLKAGGG
jgi:hypothetical protein